MGVHESIIPAAVAMRIPVERRESTYGLFTCAYRLLWIAGSAVIGVLYDRSIPPIIACCVIAEITSISLIVTVKGESP
jgi:hypothetical protein